MLGMNASPCDPESGEFEICSLTSMRGLFKGLDAAVRSSNAQQRIEDFGPHALQGCQSITQDPRGSYDIAHDPHDAPKVIHDSLHLFSPPNNNSRLFRCH
jgi:hypothetical protein